MKKMVFLALLGTTLCVAHKAEAQRIGFYFYPDLNIYFNPRTHQYAYADHGTWTYRPGPPPGVHLKRHEHVVVYGNGPEIWRENGRHRERYKNWHGRHH